MGLGVLEKNLIDLCLDYSGGYRNVWSQLMTVHYERVLLSVKCVLFFKKNLF